MREWLLALPDSCTLLLDPGPRISEIDPQFLSALKGRRVILTLNRAEAAWLCGEQETLQQAARYALEQQITLICRRDVEGAWLYTPQGESVCLPCYPVEVVDSVGAGDTHCAGVLAGLSCGWSLARSVDLANRMAAWVVAHQGAATVPSWAQLQARFTRA
ncbi:MAG: PfkB family carbohydrate kinase [Enterobacteriaceae bacterium]